MDVQQLTEKQISRLEEFRRRVQDCELNDASDDFLIKWLAARDFDVLQAEKMLRSSLEWRRINEVDNILDNWCPPEVLVKYFPAGLVGYDKFGCPLWIDPFGRADVNGLLEAVGKKDYLRYLIYLAEKSAQEMQRLSQIHGRKITLQTAIIDMDHLNIRQMTTKAAMEVGIESTKIMESHYPESLRRVYIINAPKVFTMVYAMFKPFMSPLTIEKIAFYGTDPNEWKPALLNDIDPDQLPAYYGGTMTDPDGNPMCITKICMGGEVPRTYYRSQNRPQVDEDMTSLVLNRRSKKRLEFPVQYANSVLTWKFMTEDDDLGFRIFYLQGREKMDVIPWNRVDCHLAMEEGQVACPHLTTYFVEFDNSYSVWRAKKIWFKLSLDQMEAASPEIGADSPTSEPELPSL